MRDLGIRSFTTCTDSGAAVRSIVEALTFRAVTRTLLLLHTWQASTKAILLVSSEASAKSPRRAPGTVTSTLAVAPAALLRRGHCTTGRDQRDAHRLSSAMTGTRTQKRGDRRRRRTAGRIEGGGGDGGEPAGAHQVGRHRADRNISDRPCLLPLGATRLERRARSTR